LWAKVSADDELTPTHCEGQHEIQYLEY
jgi:hypothetical protein